MKAWLITWEWGGEAAAVADKVVAILRPQWPAARVADFVELYYATCTSNITEMAYYARRRANNPYPASDDGQTVICGHNPFLSARLVDDLEIATDVASGLETIRWRTRPRYEYRDGHNVVVAEPQEREAARRITGPPSNLLIWDRLAGGYRAGWGPGETPVREGR